MLLTHIYMYFRTKLFSLLVIHHMVLPLEIVGQLLNVFCFVLLREKNACCSVCLQKLLSDFTSCVVYNRYNFCLVKSCLCQECLLSWWLRAQTLNPVVVSVFRWCSSRSFRCFQDDNLWYLIPASYCGHGVIWRLEEYWKDGFLFFFWA